MSPVKPLSIASLIDAFVDATKMVMKPTRPTPIISADALAAVRFGLRIAFSRASSPVMPRVRGSGAPITRLSGSETVRPRIDTPKNTSRAPAPTTVTGLRNATEQPEHERRDTEAEHRQPDEDALLGAVPGAAGDTELHGGDRWHLGGLARRGQRRQRR